MGDRVIITDDEKPAPDLVVVEKEAKPDKPEKVEEVTTEKTTVVKTTH